jgi:UDP-galactopyranose mutase
MSREFDFLIIGSGWYGAVCARELTNKGYKCLVIEKRDHIGGNCYTEKKEGINVHKYGAHIFHTSDKYIWDYVKGFADFNNYRHHVVANYQDELYSLPFNMWTFNKLWGVNTPEQARLKIESQSFKGDVTNFEEQALSTLGEEIYKKFVKGYTEKQWLKSAKDLPAFLIKRIPVRFTFDNNYFFDKFQGIPINGYTEIFDKLLNGIEVRLNNNYFDNREMFNSLAKNIIYTGPIDRYYDYKYGALEYRPLRFETETLDIENYQGHSVVNYTSSEIPYTRIIEHKHFNNDVSQRTIVTKEFPIPFSRESELFYPLNDIINQNIYNKYFSLSSHEEHVFFGGRLAEYKYYDQHQVIRAALDFVKDIESKSISKRID